MKYGTAGQVDGPISRRRSMERLAPDQLGVGLTGAPTDSPHTAAPGAIAIAPWANRWCMCGCLPRDLAAPANVATTEPKFAVSRQVGEWWCTVTSPAFFLGTLIYAQFPMERIEPEVHVLVWGAVGQGIISALYHAALLEAFSLLDATWAVLMMHAATVTSFGAPAWYLLVHVLSLSAVSFYYRRHADTLTVVFVILLIPGIIWGCYARAKLGSPDNATTASDMFGVGVGPPEIIVVCFALGGLCFALDRVGKARTHPLWHLFIGVMFWQSIVMIVERPCAPCLFD